MPGTGWTPGAGAAWGAPWSSALDDLAEQSAAPGSFWGAEPAPAARYAAECALADLTARRAEIPLARWLNPEAAHRVPVNAALGALGDLAPADLAATAAEGYRVLKVKVGLAPPGGRVAPTGGPGPAPPRRCGPAPRRQRGLDPGTGAADHGRAHGPRGTAGLRVESLEEPLRDPGDADLRRLQAEVWFPLALDESLHRPGSAWDLTDLPVRRLVVKPAVVGGLGRTLALAARARAFAGLELVLDRADRIRRGALAHGRSSPPPSARTSLRDWRPPNGLPATWGGRRARGMAGSRSRPIRGAASRLD